MVHLNGIMCTVLLVLVFQFLESSAYTVGPDVSPGPYCGGMRCNGRLDDCSHPILGTMCYCDEFCTRNGTTHDDCCPDYPYRTISAPMPIILQTCKHNNKEYYRGETRTENCNQCTCVSESWDCTNDRCIIDENTIRQVNRYRQWTAEIYSPFWGRKLSEGFKLLLGTLPLNRQTLNLIPDPSYPKQVELPPSFDARARWAGYITPVYDQGWCGADWAVSTAAVASDRFAIQSKGAEKVQLSAQQLVSCDVRGQQACNGGHIDLAWGFIRKNGLVDEDCFPYTGPASYKRCPRRMSTLHDAGCVTPSYGREALYTTSPPKRLGSEQAIMYEIYTSGPVQAIMTVRPDFFVYKRGVYRRRKLDRADDAQGLHAVRILGWGEENKDKYWVVANSWGPEWGEDGYFRIARGENESDIENFVIATVPNVFLSEKK